MAAWNRGGIVLLAFIALAGCSHDPAERVTGDCTIKLLGKCSSKQITVDLTDAEKATLAGLQNRPAAAPAPRAVPAAGAVLTALGFDPVSVDAANGLVQGERDRSLVSRGRQMLRAVLKSKIAALPGKPDHESTRALVTVRPAAHGSAVHVEFVTTEWDSNGDAKTHTVTDAAPYDEFYKSLSDRLK
jgi:hypothetical protein